MESTKQKNSFIHTLKGPERLSPEVIKDILDSRPIEGARRALAKKHGISEARVVKIWHEFYGGGKISDYKSGLKKPLPTEEVKAVYRKVRTPRGEYIVKEPKFTKEEVKRDYIQNKAKPMKIKKREEELDIYNEDIENITDQDAEIIAGQVGAGNDNPQLLEIFNKLIESRDRDTEYLYKLAKRRVKNNYNTDDYSTDTNIEDESNTDDSTCQYRQRNERDYEESYRDGQCFTNSNSSNAGMVLRNDYNKPMERFYSQSEREPSRFTTDRTRFTYIPETDQYPEPREKKQINSNIYPRYEQEIFGTQYNTSQRPVQQNNANNNIEFTTKPRESTELPRKSGISECQTIQGLPWLRIKPF